MTATFSRNLPMRNLWRVVRQNNKMAIVIAILSILSIPLIMGAIMGELIVESIPREPGQDYSSLSVLSGTSMMMYAMIGFAFLSATVFMGMFCAINCFTELHGKSRVDMLYSLPLTGRQRFFSHAAGGAVMYLLPYVISVILGWIMLFGMCPFVHFEELDMTRAEFLGEACHYYGLLSLGLFALRMLYYAMSVLVTVCCGTLLESIYTNILLNMLIPGCLAAVIGIVTDAISLSFGASWDIIGFTSPIGGLIYLILLVSQVPDTISDWLYRGMDTAAATQTAVHAVLPSFFRWIAVIVILSVLVLLAAWQLYVRRKAEWVGKPFVWLGAYFVMLVLLTVTMLCMMYSGIIGPVLLISAVVYCVSEIVRKRGFRRFWLTAVSYVTMVVVAVSLFGAVTLTDGFGRVFYVPAAGAVSSVNISIPIQRGYGDETKYELEYTDRDVIEAVVGLHRDLLRETRSLQNREDAINKSLRDQDMCVLYYNYSYYDDTNMKPGYSTERPWEVGKDDDDFDYFEEDGAIYRRPDQPAPQTEEFVPDYASVYEVGLTYYTYTGSKIYREFYVTADEYVRFVDIICGTDLFAEASADLLRRNLSSKYGSSYRTATGIGEEYPETIDDFCLYWISSGAVTATGGTHAIKDGKNAMASLVEAYRKDMAALTPEEMYTGHLYGFLYHDIPVWDSCEETVALLKSWNIEEVPMMVRYGHDDDEEAGYYSGSQYDTIRVYAPGTYAAGAMEYTSSSVFGRMYVKEDSDSVPAFEDIYTYSTYGSLGDLYPQMTAVLEAAEEVYISKEACYLIEVNGDPYILPPEDSHLAEELIALGSQYFASGKAFEAAAAA